MEDPRIGLRCRPETFPVIACRAFNGRPSRRESTLLSRNVWLDFMREDGTARTNGTYARALSTGLPQFIHEALRHVYAGDAIRLRGKRCHHTMPQHRLGH